MILLRLSCEIKSLLSFPCERHSMPEERTVACSSRGFGWASCSEQLLPSQKPVSVCCFVLQAKPYKSINKTSCHRLIPVSHHGASRDRLGLERLERVFPKKQRGFENSRWRWSWLRKQSNYDTLMFLTSPPKSFVSWWQQKVQSGS